MTTASSSRPSWAPWPASRTRSRSPRTRLSYTHPEEVEEFVTKTGCDSLAIAIGTSHGAYKFKPEQCTRNEQGILVPPPLRFDVLEEVSQRLPGFPIVLHGSSSVPQEYRQDDQRATAARCPTPSAFPRISCVRQPSMSVCKINIDSDLRLAMTGTIREFFNEHPDKFDPAPVSEARPCQHQGARPPQAARRSRLRRQGVIAKSDRYHHSPSGIPGGEFYAIQDRKRCSSVRTMST